MGRATDEVVRECDPVCGMSIDPRQSAFTAELLGATYHFCSADCRAAFAQDPARYASRPGSGIPRPIR